MKTLPAGTFSLEVTHGNSEIVPEINSPRSPNSIVLLPQNTYRFREGETSLALGQCVPITPSDRMWGTRQGETFTHFLSLEYKKDETFKGFQRKVADLQEKVSEVVGVGKPSKPDSLHLTIATLKVTEEEVTELKI